MEFVRWNPQIEPTKQEQFLLKQLNRVRKLFGFLRLHRHELLVHVTQRQGRRARYRGVRRNLFDLRRAAALQNLETIQRKMAA